MMIPILDNLFKTKHIDYRSFNDHLDIYFSAHERLFHCVWANPPSKSFESIKGYNIITVTEKLDEIRIYSWGPDVLLGWFPNIPECWIWFSCIDTFFHYFNMDKYITYIRKSQQPLSIQYKDTLMAVTHSPVILPIPTTKEPEQAQAQAQAQFIWEDIII